MHPIESILPEQLIDYAFTPHSSSELKVIGVGGGGCNAINYMYGLGVNDVQFIVCNTDAQALQNSPVPVKVQLGQTLTRGRGAGSKPEVGKQAAIESLDEITGLVKDNTDMAFITAGMGGGTGTGAAPVIAARLKGMGILTVAIVTVPFSTEIGDRINYARKGIEELDKVVDALIIIENEKLNRNFGELPLSEAFRLTDEVLAVAASSIVEIIKVHGQWNVDFNDVKTVMKDSRVALMGAGYAEGENRAIQAVQNAVNSPLLNNTEISGAKNILVNIISGTNEILVKEHQEICEYIQQLSGHSSEQFIIGTARDEKLGEKIKVTIIATGFNAKSVFDFWETGEKELLNQQQTELFEPEIPEEKTGDGSEEGAEERDQKESGSTWRRNKKASKDKKNSIQRLINFFDEEIS
jgi:cell division protein FtsZ